MLDIVLLVGTFTEVVVEMELLLKGVDELDRLVAFFEDIAEELDVVGGLINPLDGLVTAVAGLVVADAALVERPAEVVDVVTDVGLPSRPVELDDKLVEKTNEGLSDRLDNGGVDRLLEEVVAVDVVVVVGTARLALEKLDEEDIAHDMLGAPPAEVELLAVRLVVAVVMAIRGELELELELEPETNAELEELTDEVELLMKRDDDVEVTDEEVGLLLDCVEELEEVKIDVDATLLLPIAGAPGLDAAEAVEKTV